MHSQAAKRPVSWNKRCFQAANWHFASSEMDFHPTIPLCVTSKRPRHVAMRPVPLVEPRFRVAKRGAPFADHPFSIAKHCFPITERRYGREA
jgi:hypothetical protein